MAKFSDVLVPLLLVAWLAVVLCVMTFMGILYRNFEKSYEHRMESVKSDSEFCAKYCDGNEKDVVKYGLTEQCHERKHNSERDPVKHAMIDALEIASVCGKSGCDNVIGAFQRPLEIVFAILILLLIVTCMCGIKIFDYRANAPDPSILPTLAARKKMV